MEELCRVRVSGYAAASPVEKTDQEALDHMGASQPALFLRITSKGVGTNLGNLMCSFYFSQSLIEMKRFKSTRRN